MAGKEKSKQMDIQKPGQSKPSSSGRPIIVTNRPILQDPMVKDNSSEKSDSNKPEEVKTQTSNADKVIAPPTVTPEEVQQSNPDETPIVESIPSSKQEVNPISTSQEETGNKPEVTSTEPEASSVKPESSESNETAVVDAVLGANKPSEKAVAEKQEAEDAKRKQAVQVLVSSKKYVLPIGKASRARNNKIAILFLLLILVIFGVYLLIDMGFVSAPFELPIEFIKN